MPGLKTPFPREEVGGNLMSRIEWDNSLSVNNIEIDNQHKQWIEIYNQMHESMISGESSIETTSKILEAMYEYAKHHFSYEEEYMRKIDYPDVVAHRRNHKDFESLIYSYNRDIQEGKIVLNTKIIKLIRNWLLEHITVEDKKYAAFSKS
jgi:hemerythrin-like metal-binding protein